MTGPLRTALTVFVALGAAAALFTAGIVVGHDRMMGDDDRASMMGSSGAGMMGGSDAGMMGGSGYGAGMMGGSGAGMMGGMSIASEREFLAEMIPHHEEAIASAKVLRDGTERDEMREFAKDIIATQQAEVDDMTRWLDDWYDGAEPSTDYVPMMRPDLDELSGDELDEAFLQDMTMHHMMAVHMSRSLLARDLDEHEEATDLARTIETTQRAEIRQMQAWLYEWFDRGGSMMGTGR